MTSIEGKIRLYELVIENGRSSSPFVWRIRYALAHKGVPCETIFEDLEFQTWVAARRTVD